MTASASRAVLARWPLCCARPAAPRAYGRGAARPPDPPGQAQRDQRRAGGGSCTPPSSTCPTEVRAVVLSGEGEHFCAGLDLSELQERDVAEAIIHSRTWHAAFDADPVRPGAGDRGAARRGGRRRPRARAPPAHIRVAERSAFYGLPEGHARHLRRRRRLGAHSAPDRRRAHGRHDADRPRLRRRGGPARSACRSTSSTKGHGLAKALRARRPHRRQCAAVQLRDHAGACRASPTWRQARACSSSR